MSSEEMNHEAAIESIPAYALGALDPEEAAAVEEHLRGCEACRRELASYEPLRGDLGLAVPEVPLSEGAKERLLERTGAVRTLQSARRPHRGGSHWGSSRRLPRMLAAASLLLVLLLAGSLWQVNQLSSEVAEQEETIDNVEDLMERADVQVSDVMVSESDARTRVYEASEGDVGMFVFDNLPPLEEDQVYQLWTDSGDGLQSEGTFLPTFEDRGSYHELLEPPEGFAAYETVGVSYAPEGGLQEPPPDMLLLESLGGAVASGSPDSGSPQAAPGVPGAVSPPQAATPAPGVPPERDTSTAEPLPRG